MKRIGIVILLVVMLICLSGCGLFETMEGQKDDTPGAYDNVYELQANKAYVWRNPDEREIRVDLSANREGDEVFFACPAGDINFKGDEMSDISEYPRSIWIPSDKDDLIPTVTKENLLIYISETSVPEEIVFERFADYGYTIGISNLIRDKGGHYYIDYADLEDDDWKYYVDQKSDAKDILIFDNLSRLYLDRVNGKRVDDETVSEGGTVTGLKENGVYSCDFYTGTYYQDFMLRADTRCFGSLERFVCHDYEFLHSNCIKINIPEWFKSGYYYVQGCGLFRYVSAGDLEAYNGKAYDESINWNDPIKQYDEYGVCIYDPSLGIDTRDAINIEETQEISDEGMDEDEILIGVFYSD